MRDASPPHSDTLEVAVAHYNDVFRHRYRLRSTSSGELRQVDGIADLFADVALIRANGVADASCALIARLVASVTPRYAVGFLTSDAGLDVMTDGNADGYVSRHVILVNPLGGRDNWQSISRWFRRHGSEKARRAELAGLASEKRPDHAANDALLRQAAEEDRGAIILPPSEAFSAAKAAEVAFVFDVAPDTLRSWKQRHRSDLAAGKPGAPRKNR